MIKNIIESLSEAVITSTKFQDISAKTAGVMILRNSVIKISDCMFD